VRCADTAGDSADYQFEARRYRDYVIDSFNLDKPAISLFRGRSRAIFWRRSRKKNTPSASLPLGLLLLSRRYATAPFELMHLTVEDTIETTGRAFLG
jgi:hypothetical protein